MQDQSDVRSARAVVFWLAALFALLAPASAASAQTTAGPETAAGLSPRLLADASWHGRPIQQPWRRIRPVAVREDTASVTSLSRGTGFARAGGSDRVRRLQRRLTKLGYRPGRIDGLFGPRTQAAVMAFQRKHGLAQTGVAGSVTLRIVRQRVVGPPADRPARAAAPTQSRSSRVAAPADARTASPVSSDAGLRITPLILGLGVTALLGLVVLATLLAVRALRHSRIRKLGPGLSAPRLPASTSSRAIGYAAGREPGVRDQIEDIAAICHRRRLELVEVVSDVLDGRTGASDRPGLRRVLSRVEDGEASTVVVPALDQLGTSDEEIRGVLSTVARTRGSVIALDGKARMAAAARGGPEVVDRGGRVVETRSERLMMGIVEQAARRRDKAAGWSDVVRRFAPYVHAVLVDAYGLPERHAREVFHEVFLRTWETMDELRDADALRARVRTVTCELAKEAQDELAGEVDPPSAARLRELDNALAVREAIRSLAPVQREVATMCWIEGRDHASIATALGLSVETVAANVERVRRRLGRVLQEEGSDTTPPTPAC